MKKALIIFSIFLGLQQHTYGQFSDQNWWYFGNYTSMHFTSGVPVSPSVPSLPMWTDEAAACYSNPTTGNLVFYTNGKNVYNSSHTLISSSLNGSANMPCSSTQGALIIPKIGDPNKYWVFTTTDVPTGLSAVNYGVSYTVVDMTGPGSVPAGTLNISAPGGIKTTEHLMAVPDCDGTNYWIIAHGAQTGYQDKLLVYQLTSTGLSTPTAYASFSVPVFYSGMPPSSSYQGFIKVSPDGRKLAVSNSTSTVYLYNFDKDNGTITPASTVIVPDGHPVYGISFSPNSNQLYIGSYYNIYQCDVTTISAPVLNTNSMSMGFGLYRLQLAPDNKIYATNGPGGPSLSVINYPDNVNTISNAIGFSANSFILANSCLASLPNAVDAKKPNISSPTFVTTFNTCNEVVFNTPNCAVTGYTWNFGDGTILNTTNPAPVHTYTTAGSYTVTLTIGSFSTNQTVQILPAVLPISGPTSLCSGSSSPVYSTGPYSGYQYNWTATTGTFLTPNTNSSVQVNWTSTGLNTIGVTVTQDGCTKTNSKNVTVHPAPIASAGPNVDECSNPVIGGSPSASGGTAPYTYAWSPASGLSSSTIANPAASPTGTTLYTLTVTDANGCTANSNCTVTVGNDSWHQTTETTTGSEIYNDVITDRFGNVYTVGTYTKTTKLNGGGNPDITINSNLAMITNNSFVAKYDACGNLIWVANSTDFTGTTGVGVTLDEAAGMVYITGNFDQVMRFSSAASSGSLCSVPNTQTIFTPGSNRGYVAQFDMATGCLYFLAPLTLTVTGPLEARAITSNESTHDIYVGGQLRVGSGRPCAFIQKFTPATTFGTLNTLGAAVWTIQGDNTLPNTTYDKINDLDYNETTKTLYGIGDFKQNSKLIPGSISLSAGSAIANEAFICSYSEAGPLTQIIFSKGNIASVAGNAMYGEGIAVDEINNVAFITGTYKGALATPFFLPGIGSLSSAGTEAAYMLITNFNTLASWARRAWPTMPSGKAYGKEVACHGERGYFMGEFSKEQLAVVGSGIFYPFTGTYSTSSPNFHIFTVAYSSTGTWVNANVTESELSGNTDYHTGQSIASDMDGHCFVVGKYVTNLDYYASGIPPQAVLNATGTGANAFVMRTHQASGDYRNEMAQEFVAVSESEEILVYPNPTNATTTIEIKNFNENETYNLAIYNSVGSLVKQLTVTNSRTLIDLTGMDNGIYLFNLSTATTNQGVRIAKTN